MVKFNTAIVIVHKLAIGSSPTLVRLLLRVNATSENYVLPSLTLYRASCFDFVIVILMCSNVIYCFYSRADILVVRCPFSQMFGAKTFR